MGVIERPYKNGYYNLLCKIKKEKKGRGDKGIKDERKWREMDRRILIIFTINYKKEKREKVKEETKEWKDERRLWSRGGYYYFFD